jgi:hypothetical protein
MGISSREISPRAGTSKSASIRKLESEGGLQQTEFFNRSQFNEDVSFVCLATIKKMEVNGAFDEAQSELEQIVQKSIAPLQRGMACLLLAELFNKWGAASATYTIGIMERGFSILLLSIFNLDSSSCLCTACVFNRAQTVQVSWWWPLVDNFWFACVHSFSARRAMCD